jgi:hypothetical protein
MKYGSFQFTGDRGKHLNQQGQGCPGRAFSARQLGSGASHTNVVQCFTCLRDLPALEDRLLPDSHRSSAA